jgi:4-amino-4-deoxy-L-arabinose transferase-like glycosyltransferase
MNINIRCWYSEKYFFLVLLIISIPIMLINLGMVPFIEDEGIRGLVALEMQHSNNYITPTLYGEYYFKKPPLWNWILLLSYQLTGVANEFSTRLPTVLFMYLFTLSIYFIYKKYLDVRFAVLNALFFLTCGRILFWDSMLGLIDMAFSWVIFIFFFWLFHFSKKQKYLLLYAGAYGLIGIAFLLKALPALVFLVLTMLASHLYFKNWKKLISWQHLAGIMILGMIICPYLFLFSQYQPISKLLGIFLDESTQRTVIRHGVIDSFLQILKFPFEMIYHFLPWSSLSVMLLHKDVRSQLSKNPLIYFMSLVFLMNIWVYWTSPEVYPRYLMMFIPVYLGTCLFLYNQGNWKTLRKITDGILIALTVVVWGGSLLVFTNTNTMNLPGLWWKWSIAGVPMAIAIICMIKFADFRLHGFCVFLLAARLGFSLVVLPSRSIYSPGSQTRLDAKRIAERTQNANLFLYNHDTLRYEAGFYLTAYRGKPLMSTHHLEDDGFMLMNFSNYSTLPDHFQLIDSIRVRRDEKYVYLVKP